MLTFDEYTENTDHPGFFQREIRPAAEQVVAMLEVRRGADGYNLGATPDDRTAAFIQEFIDTSIPEGSISLKAQLDAFNAMPAPDGTPATDSDVARSAVPDADNTNVDVAPKVSGPEDTSDGALVSGAAEEAPASSRRERR